MAQLKIILFTSKKNKFGQSPVVLRLTHNRIRNFFFLSYHTTPDFWDEKTSRFKKSYPDYKKINDILRTYEQRASDILRDFERDGIEFDFHAFEVRFLKIDESNFLEPFFQKIIDKYTAEGNFGSVTPHKNTLSAIAKFTLFQRKKPVSDLKLREIDYKFLTDFEHWLRIERNCKDTSIGVYMRTLRSVVNKAIKEKLLKAELYPFKEYTFAHLNIKTKKRAITKEEVKSIENLDLVNNSPLKFAKDIFLFSYYNRGINFVDIAYLTEENFREERLTYIRRKTGQLFNIALKPQVKPILDFYRKNKLHSGKYIFPIIDEEIHLTEKQKFYRVKTVIRDVNKDLKELAEKAGLNGVNLTTYVSRHTYATVLKKAGISISMISESLGHRSEGVTHTYLKQFENVELDEADKDIL